MDTLKCEINNYFEGLTFESKLHRYKADGLVLPSVSKLLKGFTEPFNAKKVSIGVAKKRGISPEEVQSEWDAIRQEACDRGHRVHDFGEHYAFNRNLIPNCGQEMAITKFWADMPEHIVPVIMELKMFHKLFHFAGTADILLYNKIKNSFIIADYKTNNDLFKNYKGKTLLHPFDDILDSPFGKYQLQLSFYQLLFEQTRFPVSSRKIVWLRKNGEYELYDCENYTERLGKYLSERN
jgi:hypothetical protein